MYLKDRHMAGEEITPNSPLIRNLYDTTSGMKGVSSVTEPQPITTMALDMLFTRLTRRLGIRLKQPKGGKDRQKRHNIMLLHGFRKYVNRAFLNAGVNLVAKEIMIGHSPPGLEKSYLHPLESELLIGFVKAIPALTLSEELELKQQVKRLEAENADIEMLQKGFYNQQQEIAFLKQTIAQMSAASKRAVEFKQALEEEDEKNKKE
jgi:hypothetical protein